MCRCCRCFVEYCGVNWTKMYWTVLFFIWGLLLGYVCLIGCGVCWVCGVVCGGFMFSFGWLFACSDRSAVFRVVILCGDFILLCEVFILQLYSILVCSVCVEWVSCVCLFVFHFMFVFVYIWL